MLGLAFLSLSTSFPSIPYTKSSFIKFPILPHKLASHQILCSVEANNPDLSCVEVPKTRGGDS